MSDYKPVKGDRVRVVLEGEVNFASRTGSTRPDYFEVNKSDAMIYVSPSLDIKVEKIAPPVTVFKPGDVVRGRYSGKMCVLTEDGGAVRVGSGLVFEPGWDTYTSQYFEQVELPSAH